MTAAAMARASGRSAPGPQASAARRLRSSKFSNLRAFRHARFRPRLSSVAHLDGVRDFADQRNNIPGTSSAQEQEPSNESSRIRGRHPPSKPRKNLASRVFQRRRSGTPIEGNTPSNRKNNPTPQTHASELPDKFSAASAIAITAVAYLQRPPRRDRPHSSTPLAGSAILPRRRAPRRSGNSRWDMLGSVVAVRSDSIAKSRII